ncbi:cytochrome P450 [Xylariales sp. PMI_506]|nr:cytochrome P450 [Xylariales sp. PMI_506]
MAAQESGKGLSLDEMHSNADFFMLAGLETTATLLSGFTYHLLANPNIMQALRDEIRGEFSSLEEVDFERTAGMKYLNACLREALRLYPPVPIGVPRVIPEGGLTALGRWIAPETRASAHQYSTNHSAVNFKNPDKFAPERWLGDPAYADDDLNAAQPFSWGPRNCIGQNMAMYEMRLILAMVLLSFDIELCDDRQDWLDQKSFSLWIKRPLNCRIKGAGC